MIVEYSLDAGLRGMIVPYWVEEGGYFQDPDNFTLVGWTLDAPHEFKVPDTVLVLGNAAFVARILDTHSYCPMKKDVGRLLCTC